MLHRTLDLNVPFGTTNTIKNLYVILNLESHESLWVMFIAKKKAEQEDVEWIHQTQ
jgi:hypothetical protein